MKLKQKIQRGIGLAAIALLTRPIAVKAQDFCNGVRGPSNFQLDLYGNHASGEHSSIAIAKLFTKRALIAAPFSAKDGKAENQGLNVGYIAENFSDNNKAIVAVGIFKDGTGEYNVVNPQAYFTHMSGEWTVDLEAQAPFNTKARDLDGRISATIGKGVGDRWRLGGSVTAGTGIKPVSRVNIRYEVMSDHTVWAQAYVDDKSFGVRMAINVP